MDVMNDASRYTGVFRHEVGHAVESALGGSANSFKQDQGGWTKYASVDTFIAAMGGYGNIPATLQPIFKDAMTRYMGSGGTFAAPTATFEETLEAAVMAANPDVIESAEDGSDAVSVAMATFKGLYDSNFPLKAMIAAQGNNNYWRFDQWQVANGKAFFPNHWYARGYSVAAATHTDLKSWPDQSAAQSAAFSDAEWFAESYSVWYGTATPGTSHSWAPFMKTYFETTVAALGAPGSPTAPSPGGGHPKVQK